MARILPVGPGHSSRPDCGAPVGTLGSNSDHLRLRLGRSSNFWFQPDGNHLRAPRPLNPVSHLYVLAVARNYARHIGNSGAAVLTDLEIVQRRGAGGIEVEA